MCNTKKIRINLAALTRVEYSEILEVPSDISNGQLTALVEQRYRDIDGGNFYDDPDYWERGHCYHETVDANEAIDGTVAIDGGEIIVIEMTATPT